MPRPETYPDFATTSSGTNIATPDTAHQTSGFVNEFVPRQWLNFLFQWNGKWVRWLDEITQGLYASVQSLLGRTGEDIPWDTLHATRDIAAHLDWLTQRSNANVKQGYGMEISATGLTRFMDISSGVTIMDENFLEYPVYSIAALNSDSQKDLSAVWAEGLTGQGAVPAAIFPLTGINTCYVFVIYNQDSGLTDIAIDTSPTGSNINSTLFPSRKRIGVVVTEVAAGINIVKEILQIGDTAFVSYAAQSVTNPGPSGNVTILGAPAGYAICQLEIVVENSGNVGTISVLSGTNLSKITIPMGESQIVTLPLAGGFLAYEAYWAVSNSDFTVRLLNYRKPSELNS